MSAKEIDYSGTSRSFRQPMRALLMDSEVRANCIQLIKKFAQFCVVGFSGMAVDMTMLYLLTSPRLLGWNLTLSKVLAAETAIMNNFLWNDIWTFRASAISGSQSRLARLGNFNLICLFGIAFSVLLLDIQVYWLRLNPYAANFFAIVAVSLWNFFMSLKFGWGGRANSTPNA